LGAGLYGRQRGKERVQNSLLQGRGRSDLPPPHPLTFPDMENPRREGCSPHLLTSSFCNYKHDWRTGRKRSGGRAQRRLSRPLDSECVAGGGGRREGRPGVMRSVTHCKQNEKDCGECAFAEHGCKIGNGVGMWGISISTFIASGKARTLVTSRQNMESRRWYASDQIADLCGGFFIGTFSFNGDTNIDIKKIAQIMLTMLTLH